MANEVDIKVRADQTDANLDETRRQSKGLKEQVVADASAMEKASARLETARRRQADAAGQLRVAEVKLHETQENSKASMSQLAAAEEERAKRLRVTEAAAQDMAAAEERLKKIRDAEAEAPPEPEPGAGDGGGDKEKTSRFDRSKSFLDKDQLLGEAKSYGMQAGAVLAGAIGAGVSSIGAAGLFIGIAAAAQSSNARVADAYSKMWDQVKLGAQDSSSVLANDFISAAESLGSTFNALQPQLTEGFLAAKPVIADVMDGIDRGAKSAMPGLVTAAQAAGQASNGLADMLDSAGKSVSNFFTESSKGASAGGDAFRAFGLIVERLGSFAGRILAQLANSSGSVWGPLTQAVDSTATAIESLASSALPGLASGASFALSGLSLLMNLASTLMGVLGPMVPVIMQVASALKLVDMVSFGQVGKSWEAFKSKVGEGEGVFGKIKAGAGGLLSTLGPVGLAAGLVTVGLGYLSTEQQAAAAATASHAKRVDLLTDALRKSKGAIDGNVRASAAEALSNMAVNKAYQDGETIKKNMIQGARELGINQGLLTDAYLGQGDALAQLNGQLSGIMSPYKDYNDMVAHANPEEQKRWMLAELMKDTLNKQGGEFKTAAQNAQDFAAASGSATVATSILGDEFKALADKEGDAASKAEALMKIMDTMAGRKPDVEAATEAWEKFIDAFTKKDMNFEDKNAGTKKYVQSLIDASGQINLTTADGRKLFDTVREGEKDFESTAIAMKDSGANAADIQVKLQSMRDAFLKSAEAMGFTKDQAAALADKYGLIPQQVATIITSNLAPELQNAIALGGTVRALPDGSFVVTANTSAAQGMINKLVQTNDGRVINIHVNTTTGAQLNTVGGSWARLQAAGGPVGHAAEGGARTGPVIVNEQGQEGARLPGGNVITLPMGSSVIPHSNMQSMAAGAGAPRVEVIFGSDGSDTGEFLARLVQRYVRVKGGGDVQVALGWS